MINSQHNITIDMFKAADFVKHNNVNDEQLLQLILTLYRWLYYCAQSVFGTIVSNYLLLDTFVFE